MRERPQPLSQYAKLSNSNFTSAAQGTGSQLMRHKYKFNARPLPVLNPNNETRRFCHFPMLSQESGLEINRDESDDSKYKKDNNNLFWGWTWSTPTPRAQSSFIACQLSYEHFSPQWHERRQIGIIILSRHSIRIRRSLALWNPPTFTIYCFYTTAPHCGFFIRSALNRPTCCAEWERRTD